MKRTFIQVTALNRFEKKKNFNIRLRDLYRNEYKNFDIRLRIQTVSNKEYGSSSALEPGPH